MQTKKKICLKCFRCLVRPTLFAAFWLLGAGVLSATWTSSAAADEPLVGLDTFIADAMAEWQVPGLAIAVVHDDRVVLNRAYGERDVDLKLPVTTETLFALGSVSKSFTVLDLAILEAGQKFLWDAPLIEKMPDFALLDPEATAKITPRDLVTHRSGLPRHDVLWYVDAFSRSELVQRIRYLKPTKALRQAFQYQNLMFLVASALVESLSGQSWEDFTRTHLLNPLGMLSTRMTLAGFLVTPDIASPYFPGDEGRVAVALRDSDPIAPAGGIYSNVEDMARYLRFLLARGSLSGQRLIPEAAFGDLWQSHIALSPGSGHRGYRNKGYAMGLYLASYQGQRVLRHGGAFDGYLSELAFMPDADIGVIVLSNLSGNNPVPRLIALRVFDQMLGLAPKPWIERQRAVQAEYEKTRGQRGVWPLTEPADGPPPQPAKAYAGVYEHPAYGPIEIQEQMGTTTLTGRFHDIPFSLAYVDENRWQVPETAWPLRRGLTMQFRADQSGAIRQLVSPIADGPTYRYNPGAMVFERRQ